MKMITPRHAQRMYRVFIIKASLKWSVETWLGEKIFLISFYVFIIIGVLRAAKNFFVYYFFFKNHRYVQHIIEKCVYRKRSRYKA